MKAECCNNQGAMPGRRRWRCEWAGATAAQGTAATEAAAAHPQIAESIVDDGNVHV